MKNTLIIPALLLPLGVQAQEPALSNTVARPGITDGMAYRVTIKRAEDEDRLILVSHTEYEKQMMFGTEYLLQWCLYADREQERLVLERIG